MPTFLQQRDSGELQNKLGGVLLTLYNIYYKY